ncbi:peroxisomal membrane protein 11C isoform X2 [Cygnus olor]|uniref:peroxisomal membrane protein 11C isoform X2 n=1 Tax=Cygnus olor TaxID=8869 RepID=UPI001ADEB5F7|nr:peroxisomal membrane protein 11C isoform X2 [Cygnus olor]
MATAPLRHVPGLPRAPRPGSVAMAAGGLRGLVAALESYRGRDRAVSGGGRPGKARSRLFLTGLCLRRSARSAMAASWLAGRWEDGGAPQLGCPGASWPCRRSSATAAPSCGSSTTSPCSATAAATGWGPRSLRILFQLRKKLRQQKGTSSPQDHKKMKAQVKSEVLSIVSNMADLANAIHWLPPGFLWAGRFPPWLVGLLGTISSLIGIYQASREGNSGAV